MDQADCLVKMHIHSIFDMEPLNEKDISDYVGKSFSVVAKVSTKIKKETKSLKAVENKVNGRKKNKRILKTK